MFNYITVLSNWLIGYEKYSKRYSKNNIKFSTYPNEFYILKENELDIGLNKAKRLIEKLNSDNSLILNNNKIIRIESNLNENIVNKNNRNNLGWVINQNWIPVSNIYIYENEKWIKKTIEEITALAYRLNYKDFKKYSELKPRSLSILPVAKACQADCKFCFSESSISFDQKRSTVNFKNLIQVCKAAKSKGAERFVITGGGEPTLIKEEDLIKIIKIAKTYFDKVILISNGLFLSEQSEEVILDKIKQLIDAGLSVLSISYHHYDFEINSIIMGKKIKTDYLLDILKKNNINNKLTIRLICVLQKEGISNQNEIKKYIEYAITKKVNQICFKELYVSSTEESLYAGQEQNKYSEENQISLSILTDFLDNTSNKFYELPWGSPVYKYKGIIDIAAYTEPSVGWERINGIARSWNIMADGKCFVSLEDINSIMEIKDEL